MKRNEFSRWEAVKVKAKYDFTCAKCGSMENIQAHDPTKKHSDWRVGIALCGDCHSKEHPDRPKGLFAKKSYQPAWHNISARSLAKEIGCHSRTVFRHAKKLGIPFGQPLSDENRQRLIRSCPPGGATIVKATKSGIKIIPVFLCLRCEHFWRSKQERPRICPKCKSKLWYKAKKKRGQGNDNTAR